MPIVSLRTSIIEFRSLPRHNEPRFSNRPVAPYLGGRQNLSARKNAGRATAILLYAYCPSNMTYAFNREASVKSSCFPYVGNMCIQPT